MQRGNDKRVVVIAACGLLITFGAGLGAWFAERSALEAHLGKHAANRTQAARERLQRAPMALELLAALYRSSEQVTAAEFEEFATHVLATDFDALWVAWRATPPVGTLHLAPATSQASASQVLAALPATPDSRAAAATYVADPERPLLILRRAIADPSSGPQDRGEVLVAIDLSATLAAHVHLWAPAGLDQCLVQRGTPDRLLAVVPSRTRGPLRGPAPDWLRLPTAGDPERFHCAGLDLELVCTMAPAAPQQPFGPLSLAWTLGLVGLLATAAVVHGQRVAEHGRQRAEELVAARTRELAHANATLETRVAERTAELELAHREMEAFSFSVSHDLRAPLRAIDGFAGMLAEDHAADLPAEGHRLLGVIRSSSHDMSQLIDALLRLSRLGRHALVRSRVDVDGMVHEVVAELRAHGEGTQHEITAGPLGVAEADPVLLREVFRNLIGNAVKFSRDRQPAQVRIERVADATTPTFQVVDNGVGFDPAFRHKLFAPFQRLHRQDEFDGTGIGLALCQRIVARHGGSIEADARDGHGATFRFRLGPAPSSTP